MARPEDTERGAELPARIARGDAEAEAELVARYRPGLLVMFRHRGHAADSLDLCQETLRIALENLRAGQLRDGDKLTAYLWGIAGHLSNRAHDRAARERPFDDDIDARAGDGPSPEAAAEAMERRRLVRETMSTLPVRDREILQDFYLHDRAKEEICRERGLTPAQFDLVKFRALRRLAKAMTDATARRARTDEA
jgi:RNA polymerase sigma factor (sigma-70 family)